MAKLGIFQLGFLHNRNPLESPQCSLGGGGPAGLAYLHLALIPEALLFCFISSHSND